MGSTGRELSDGSLMIPVGIQMCPLGDEPSSDL